MKIWQFILITACINLVLFVIVYLLPVNIIQLLIVKIVQIIVILFGVKAIAVSGKSVTVIIAYGIKSVKFVLDQCFYEVLTAVSMTVPLFLQQWWVLVKKLGIIISVIISYYVLLYSLVIILYAGGYTPNLLTRFVQFNIEYFMIFFVLLVWFMVSKKEIISLIKSNLLEIKK